jgi:hypothetical protein
MKANLKTWKRFLIASILSFAIISVSVHASTINLLPQKNKDGLLDANNIDNLASFTWNMELGKNVDESFRQFQITYKKMVTKENALWESDIYNWDGWTKLIVTDIKDFKANVAVKNIEFEVSKSIPSPIPSTVWIFGASLIGLIGVRRKFHTYIS